MGVLLVKAVASLLLPPGIILVLLIAGLLVLRRRKRTGIVLITSGVAILIILSQPWVAIGLLRSVERYPALDTQAALSKDAAIVLLGGGYYPNAPEYGGADTVAGAILERMRYAVWLHKRSGLPILVSGGSVVEGEGEPEGVVVARVMHEDYGVAPRWVEEASRNTRENARNTREILAEAGIDHIYLVTHAWHMARAARSFERTGLTVTPAPTMFLTTGDAGLTVLDFLPSTRALAVSTTALHEMLGSLWYWIRD